MPQNIDQTVVTGFGEEWATFDQSNFLGAEYDRAFDAYFAIFPWDSLPPNAEGFDLGSGSGRWARGVAARVGLLHCIEPSSAIEVTRKNLQGVQNVRFHKASVDAIPLPDSSQDFGYSLGVLHHVPDTGAGISACVAKLKPNAPFLLYLYYAFDNRPAWFRSIWRVSEIARSVLSRSPFPVRLALSQVIALLVYLPLARIARAFQVMGLDTKSFPLAAYAQAGFYTMRTDALDRFGTSLERRFSKSEIKSMMESAGLRGVVFSDALPHWCAVGRKI